MELTYQEIARIQLARPGARKILQACALSPKDMGIIQAADELPSTEDSNAKVFERESPEVKLALAAWIAVRGYYVDEDLATLLYRQPTVYWTKYRLIAAEADCLLGHGWLPGQDPEVYP